MRNLNIKALVKGLGLMIICSLLGSIILALLLYFTAFSEELLPRSGQIIQFLAILLGSTTAAKIAGCKGLYHGIAVALISIIALLFINLAMFHYEFLLARWLQKCLLLIFAGALGGMIGVGLSER